MGAEPLSTGTWNTGALARICRESPFTGGSRGILSGGKGGLLLSLPSGEDGSGWNPRYGSRDASLAGFGVESRGGLHGIDMAKPPADNRGLFHAYMKPRRETAQPVSVHGTS